MIIEWNWYAYDMNAANGDFHASDWDHMFQHFWWMEGMNQGNGTRAMWNMDLGQSKVEVAKDVDHAYYQSPAF